MTQVFKLQPYYHGTVKKLVIAFGNFFSGIRITRTDSNNVANQVLEVPISYGPKDKWLRMITERPDYTKGVQIVLPRISFEIVDYRYNPERRIGTVGSYRVGTVDNMRAKVFNPVPYDVHISLHSLCNSQEESLQILEQILPYFSPSINISVEVIPEFGIRKDIPLVLQGVDVVDTYEGSPQELRSVTQTFNFVAQLDLFGPINYNNKIIKKVYADLEQMSGDGQGQVATGDYRYGAKVNPLDANKDDQYVIDESWFGENSF